MAGRDVLTETEAQILALKIAHPELTHREIAERLHLSRPHVSALINQNPLRQAIDEHLQDIVDTAKELAVSSLVKAFNRLTDLIDHGDSDFVKLRAARDLILILQKRGDDEGVGEEVWESFIGQYGQVKIERVKQAAENLAIEDDNGREAN